MAKRVGASLTIIAVASLAGACTTVLYKGPQRPASEIAVIVSKDTMIDKVDSLIVRDNASGNSARFEVLPGDHEIGVSLLRTIPGFLTTKIQHSGYIVLCLTLEGGHTYRTHAVMLGQRWAPIVIDETARRAIDGSCDKESERVAAAPPEPARPTTPPLNAPAAPDVSTTEGGAPGPIVTGAAETPPVVTGAAETSPVVTGAAETSPVVTGAAKTSPVVDAAAGAPAAEQTQGPHVVAVDPDEPRHQPGAAATPAHGSSSDAEASGRRPGSGLSIFTGFAFGGADFVKATSSSGNDETLSSGQGFILGIGAMVTPLWPSDLIGFGVGVDGALKYDSIDASNGSASITRFPVALTAHLLTGPDGNNFFMLKGGIARDFGVSYSVSGFDMIDANVRGEWGPTGAFGYYKRSNDSFAWDILGVFTLTNHLVGDEKVNASSFGITFGAHLNL